MSDSRDRMIELGEVKLAVQERGAGAPPLVLVHGYTGSKVDWADVIDDLARDRRVIAYDQRGHGESTNLGVDESYNLEQLESDLSALLDALGPGPVHLLGHSMGGMVALRAVLSRPEQICSLILMDTSADPVSGMPRQIFSALAKIGREEGMASLHRKIQGFIEKQSALVRGHLSPETRAVLEARTRIKFEQLDVAAFETLATVLSEFPPMSPRLVEIGCPTTVIIGEHDTGTREGERGFRASAEVLAEGIAGAELRVIPIAGHCPQEENRSDWLGAVEELLASLDTQGESG